MVSELRSGPSAKPTISFTKLINSSLMAFPWIGTYEGWCHILCIARKEEGSYCLGECLADLDIYHIAEICHF